MYLNVFLQLASHLAARGYTFVGSNLYQPLPPFLAAAFASSKRVPRGNCPSGRFLAASASLIPTFLEWARNSSLPAVQVGITATEVPQGIRGGFCCIQGPSSAHRNETTVFHALA